MVGGVSGAGGEKVGEIGICGLGRILGTEMPFLLLVPVFIRIFTESAPSPREVMFFVCFFAFLPFFLRLRDFSQKKK